jgi:hypothetical protein
MRSNIVREWNAISVYRKILRVVLVGLIIFAGWAASPLFYNRTVDEAFPASVPAAPTARAEAPAAMADAAVAPTAMAAAAPDVMAPAPAIAPTAMAAAAPDAMAQAPEMAPTAMAAAAQVATIAPVGPVALQMGSFVDGSLPGHHAAGTATIYRLEDGRQILRLENFEATNGPDLFVTFHPGANPEQDAGEYLQISPLKGNRGDQNYDLPADFDLAQYQSAVIWCRSFNVVFGYATLGLPA